MNWKLILLLTMVVLIGCGEAAGEVAPLPTALETAVSINPDEGSADLPTATVVPLETATLPPAPTLPPPATSVPEPTADAIAETAVSLLAEADFGENINRLTGEAVDDPTVLERRPVAVKISNAPAIYVRPQSGMSAADLVFEHVTEGGITRFTAVFYGQVPPDIGPIRSARLIDIELPAMYDTALAYSGASIGVSNKLQTVDFASRVLRVGTAGYYRTGEDKPFEHTLYGSLDGFRQTLTSAGLNTRPGTTSQMTFASQPPANGTPATTINVSYPSFANVGWTYDPANNRYWRTIDGEPHIDKNNGEQLSARNVVVVFANHQLDVSICETQVEDQCLAFSMEIQIWGEGTAVIFRDGQRFEATWRRAQRNDMLTFYDEAGNPLPLQVGNTWFQMLPNEAGLLTNE